MFSEVIKLRHLIVFYWTPRSLNLKSGNNFFFILLNELTRVFCYKVSSSVSSYTGLTEVSFITFYLIVEVTTFSQSVDVEEALPHTSSQAWRNAHPYKTLNLKNKKLRSSNVIINIFPFLKILLNSPGSCR